MWSQMKGIFVWITLIIGSKDIIKYKYLNNIFSTGVIDSVLILTKCPFLYQLINVSLKKY